MRFVFVPWELSLPSLLVPDALPEDVRLSFVELCNAPEALGTDAVLARIEKLVLRTISDDVDTRGVVLLLYAAALWQAERWLEVLDVVQQARSVLYFSVAPEARYHEALAAYLEGLLALSLHADARSERLLRAAQAGLDDAARYWGYGRDTARMQACQDVQRWISDLLSALNESAAPGLHYLLPLFEETQGLFQRVGLFGLPSPHLILSEGTLSRVYEAGYFEVHPLSSWRVPLLSPAPGSYYCAQRILVDGDGVPQSRAGDMLLLERSTLLPEGEHGVFIRRYHDGRILFRTQVQGRGFSGIAKALLRRRGVG